MADPTAIRSGEEIIALIAKTAEDLRADDFRVRVQRRKQNATIPEQILTMEGARAEHFAAVETWLPRIAGGGTFLVAGYHCSNPSAIIGGPFPVEVAGPAREVNPLAAEDIDWAGPRTVVYPVPKKNGLRDLTPLPGGADASPRTSVSDAPGVGGSSLEQAAARQLIEVQRQKDLLAEDRRKMEVDGIRKEGQTRVEFLERKAEEERRRFEDLVKAARAPTEPHGESAIEKMLAALVPLGMRYFETAAADRRATEERRSAEERRFTEVQSKMQFEMAKMQSETQLAIARAQADAAARTAEMQMKAAEQQAAMQSQLAARADETNKMLMRTILDRPKDDSSSRTAELVASMAGTTMNVMNTMVELGLTGGGREPEEPTALKVAREVVRGIAAMSAGAAGARAPLPAAFQGSTQPPAPESHPEPEPTQPEALQANEPSTFDRIIFAIKDITVPTKEIAEGILQSLSDPSVIAAYTRAGGDFRELFGQELDGWLDAPQNKDRLKSILRETMQQGVTAKLFPADGLKDLEESLAAI